jgi:hypothetical protein
VLGYAKGAKAGRLKVHFQCVDCEKVTVRLSGWQFWNVPRIPGRAIGGGCGLGKAVKLKRTSLDNFDGVVPLNKCERQRLSDVVALERRGKAKLRRFEFRFGTDGGTSGEAFIGGRR